MITCCRNAATGASEYSNLTAIATRYIPKGVIRGTIVYHDDFIGFSRLRQNGFQGARQYLNAVAGRDDNRNRLPGIVNGHCYYDFAAFSIFAQESRSDTVRLNTSLSLDESTQSTQKYPWRSN